MGDVVNLDCVTRLPLNPERVLDAAKAQGLTTVVILGYDAEGNEYFASSEPNGPEVLWMLERSAKKLLTMADTGGYLEA